MAVIIGPVAHTCHLAATEDGAVDDGAAANVDMGVSYTAGGHTLVIVDVAAAGAEDVADAEVAGQQGVGVVAADDGVAADGDGGLAVMDGVVVAAAVDKGGVVAVHVDTGECQSATAIDGAIEVAAADINLVVALDASTVGV